MALLEGLVGRLLDRADRGQLVLELYDGNGQGRIYGPTRAPQILVSPAAAVKGADRQSTVVIERARLRQREAASAGDGLPNELHPVSRRVLLARGVQDESALSLNLQELHSPDGLSDIDTAAQLLADAIMQDQSVLIVGDFDADGATGTALAVLVSRGNGLQAPGLSGTQSLRIRLWTHRSTGRNPGVLRHRTCW